MSKHLIWDPKAVVRRGKHEGDMEIALEDEGTVKIVLHDDGVKDGTALGATDWVLQKNWEYHSILDPESKEYEFFLIYQEASQPCFSLFVKNRQLSS